MSARCVPAATSPPSASETWQSDALTGNRTANFLDWSASGSCYYLNHCSCDAVLDDFDPDEEPEDAFFPMEPDECGGMRLITLPAMADLTVSGSCMQSHFDWQRHVPREWRLLSAPRGAREGAEEIKG